MPRRSEPADVQVIPVLVLAHAQLIDPGLQHIIAFLPLGAADDLSDPRHQAVRRRDRLSIFIQLHVKRLDLPRIIRHKDRTLKDLLCQIALMLRLQVAAPADLIIKLVVIFLQEPHRLRIGHTAKLRIHHMVQAVQQPLVHKLIEERHLLRRIFQDIPENELEHRFRQVHVILQVGKRDLRLDHPEFRRMARRV